MVDIMPPETRSHVMSRIRGKNTTPERYVAALLSAAGLTFTRHDKTIPGRPDFVFKRAKVAVFVNGDFWHGWRFPVWEHKLQKFWRKKISGNRARDARNRRKLSSLGWKVVTVWEHQVESDPLACVRRIARAIGTKAIDRRAVENRLKKMPTLRRRKRLPKP